MKSLIDDVTTRLSGFVAQRDDVGLVLSCSDNDAILLLSILQGLDEASTSELYWIFPDPFQSAGTYLDQIMEAFTAKHEAIRLVLQQEGMPPWPSIPEVLTDGSLAPPVRMRELMKFSRSLSPAGDEGVTVWGLMPMEIHDQRAYADLMTEVFQHEYPFPWCHHLRIIARDDREEPRLTEVAGQFQHLQRFAPDLSQDALRESMDQDAADESKPMDERLQNVVIQAGMDYANRDFKLALEKHEIALPYYVKTDNGLMASLVMNGMGECHRELKDLESAERCFEQAIEPAAEEEPPSIPLLLNIHLNLANLTMEQERWIEAEGYYHSAQEYAVPQLDHRTHIRCLENRGIAQYEQGKTAPAVESWKQAAEVAHTTEEEELKKSVLDRLRTHYERVGDRAGLRSLNEIGKDPKEHPLGKGEDRPGENH